MSAACSTTWTSFQVVGKPYLTKTVSDSPIYLLLEEMMDGRDHGQYVKITVRVEECAANFK